MEDSSRHVVKSCFHFIAYPTQAKTCMEADSNSLPSSIISYPHCLWPCIQPLPAWESPPSVLLTSTWEAPSCQAHPAPGFPILWLFHLFRLKVQHLSPTHPLRLMVSLRHQSELFLGKPWDFFLEPPVTVLFFSVFQGAIIYFLFFKSWASFQLHFAGRDIWCLLIRASGMTTIRGCLRGGLYNSISSDWAQASVALVCLGLDSRSKKP